MHKIKKKRYTLLFFFMCYTLNINKKDKDELFNKGLSEKEIETLTQKGFTKEEMIQSHQYNNEIKKGSNFISWLIDLITWLIP